MGGIFLSYRREDAAGHTGRLYDRLSVAFGEDQVFRDLDSLTYGTEFLRSIKDAVSTCDSMVAVIGREWVTVSKRDGGRRLDDPRDFVRLEIAAALERGIPVIPVLVEGAEMPAEDDLPVPLVRLSHFNGLSLSDDRWDYDVKRLVATLERWTPRAVSATSGSTASGSPSPPAPPLPSAPPPHRAPALSPAAGIPGWLKVALPLAVVAAVVLASVLVLAGGGGSGGDGEGPVSVRQVDVEVPGGRAWTATTLSVSPGDEVSVNATGQIRDDAQRRPNRRFGPDGLDDPPSRVGDPVFGTFHAALIGKVGEGKPFALGASGTHRVEEAGSLYLGTNDSYVGDNDGSYHVRVIVRSR